MIPSSIPFTCEECGARFAPQAGASCTRCGRLLCARHFSVLRTLGLRLGSGPPVCAACRRQEREPQA